MNRLCRAPPARQAAGRAAGRAAEERRRHAATSVREQRAVWLRPDPNWRRSDPRGPNRREPAAASQANRLRQEASCRGRRDLRRFPRPGRHHRRPKNRQRRSSCRRDPPPRQCRRPGQSPARLPRGAVPRGADDDQPQAHEQHRVEAGRDQDRTGQPGGAENLDQALSHSDHHELVPGAFARSEKRSAWHRAVFTGSGGQQIIYRCDPQSRSQFLSSLPAAKAATGPRAQLPAKSGRSDPAATDSEPIGEPPLRGGQSRFAPWAAQNRSQPR